MRNQERPRIWQKMIKSFGEIKAQTLVFRGVVFLPLRCFVFERKSLTCASELKDLPRFCYSKTCFILISLLNVLLYFLIFYVSFSAAKTLCPTHNIDFTWANWMSVRTLRFVKFHRIQRYPSNARLILDFLE